MVDFVAYVCWSWDAQLLCVCMCQWFDCIDECDCDHSVIAITIPGCDVWCFVVQEIWFGETSIPMWLYIKQHVVNYNIFNI